MKIKPIQCNADYDAALSAIDSLMGAAPNTPEGDELEVPVTLVEAYEAERWPIEAPDPISAIEQFMGAHGLRRRDFAALIGSQPRASEVLNRPRPLTLSMIRLVRRVEHPSRCVGSRVRPHEGSGCLITAGIETKALWFKGRSDHRVCARSGLQGRQVRRGGRAAASQV